MAHIHGVQRYLRARPVIDKLAARHERRRVYSLANRTEREEYGGWGVGNALKVLDCLMDNSNNEGISDHGISDPEISRGLCGKAAQCDSLFHYSLHGP